MDEMIYTGIFLTGGESTSVFLQGKERDLSPCLSGQPVTYSTCQPPPLDLLVSQQSRLEGK